MPKLVFDTCCCCAPPGCLLIAYLHLVYKMLMIVLAIVGITVKVTQHTQEADIRLLAFPVVLLIFFFFLLAFTTVLLVGLHKHKRGHIKTYLIYAVISLVITIILFFARVAGPIRAGDVISKLAIIVPSTYFLLVIRSYYYKMDDKRPAVCSEANALAAPGSALDEKH